MFMGPHRHTVLISGSQSDSKSVAAIMSAMRFAGAVPMLIADHAARLSGEEDATRIKARAAVDMTKVDGALIMGNDLDIHPNDYGVEELHPKTNPETNAPGGCARATYEYALIGEALTQGKPLLCICGGMQRLNVLLGGTLHQHVPDLVGHGRYHQGDSGIAPFIPVQYVAVVPGTRLAQIGKEVGGIFTPQHAALPPGVFMENAFHHQAVDRVGSDLIPCAFSVEPEKSAVRIVQAIESDPEGKYKDQFVLGLQWHPEFGASDLSIRSLQHFDAAARDWAKGHPREMVQEEILANALQGVDVEKWAFKEVSAVDFDKARQSTSLPQKPKPKGKGR